MAKIMLGITIFLVSIFFAATIWYKVNPDQFTDDIRIFPFWPDRLIDTIRFFPNYNPFGKQYDSDLLKANALAADTASQTRLQQGSLVVKTILQMAPGERRFGILGGDPCPAHRMCPPPGVEVARLPSQPARRRGPPQRDHG